MIEPLGFMRSSVQSVCFKHYPRVRFQSHGDKIQLLKHCVIDKIFMSEIVDHFVGPFHDKIYIALQVSLFAKEMLLLNLVDEFSEFFWAILSSFLLFLSAYAKDV